MGKTAIVELLAQRMVAGDVPASIADCELWSLDIGALVAGTKFHGSLEERIKGVLDEVKAANGKIILFLDECHLIMSAGAASTGGINAANLLKPMVSPSRMCSSAAMAACNRALPTAACLYSRDGSLIPRCNTNIACCCPVSVLFHVLPFLPCCSWRVAS